MVSNNPVPEEMGKGILIAASFYAAILLGLIGHALV